MRDSVCNGLDYVCLRVQGQLRNAPFGLGQCCMEPFPLWWEMIDGNGLVILTTKPEEGPQLGQTLT